MKYINDMLEQAKNINVFATYTTFSDQKKVTSLLNEVYKCEEELLAKKNTK